jgi:aminocarboxymuconate-semialdehyde decarboxylase
MKRKPTDYLRHIYYDTITYNLGALQYLISVVGEEHVMFGTDWPHQVHDTKGAFANTAQLSAQTCAAIRGGNALKVFNIS